MPQLGPQTTDEILTACCRGADGAAAALSHAFDRDITLDIGHPEVLAEGTPPDQPAGPGLAIVLKTGNCGALLLLEEATGLLPAWYQSPDAAGEAQLATLARELGARLLPAEIAPEAVEARYLSDLAVALVRGEITAAAKSIPLRLTAGEATGVLHFVWPVRRPEAVFADPAITPKPAPQQLPPAAGTAPEWKFPTASLEPAGPPPPRMVEYRDRLPPFGRSLLRIQVPASVTIGSTRKTIGQILRLRPGAILPLNKPCDEALELNVAHRPIATGEVVKVGDRFGIRITSMGRT